MSNAWRRHDQVGLLKYLEVLGHRLPGHIQVLAKLAQRLPVISVQHI